MDPRVKKPTLTRTTKRTAYLRKRDPRQITRRLSHSAAAGCSALGGLREKAALGFGLLEPVAHVQLAEEGDGLLEVRVGASVTCLTRHLRQGELAAPQQGPQPQLVGYARRPLGIRSRARPL